MVRSVVFVLGMSLLGIAGCGGGDPESTPTATATATPTSTMPTPTATPDLVADGARLFFEETFDGNGRTCGTCHPAANAFTLSPQFIATLRDDDPLFVAEQKPELAGLENPGLLRSRALILENVDGFDQPPVFRGVPHIFDEGFTAPYGWSGSLPSLRDFTIRAVTQHFPRTLNRVAGVDFRLPTDDELTAIVAFMTSTLLPADGNFDVDALLTTEPQRRGFARFLSAGCEICHTLPLLTSNLAFDTGVTKQPIDTVPPPECDPPCPPLGPLEAGGSRAFDVPTLFGLRRTAPYFHDDSAASIRDAVAFYGGPQFNASPGAAFAGPISLTDGDIDDIAAFLTALDDDCSPACDE